MAENRVETGDSPTEAVRAPVQPPGESAGQTTGQTTERSKQGRPLPPAGHRFKPGQSGNPGGRPRTAHLSAAYRQKLEEPVPGDKAGRTHAEVIGAQLAKRAARGDVGAAKELADRTEGKALQKVDATVSAGVESMSSVERKHRIMEFVLQTVASMSESQLACFLDLARELRDKQINSSTAYQRYLEQGERA